jgi:hypothetical protein
MRGASIHSPNGQRARTSGFEARGSYGGIQANVPWRGDGDWQCAGINRHAVEDERALQERSSEPPGLESCGGSREAAVEA